MKRCTFAVLAVMLVLMPWRESAHADATRYTIENLGTFQGLVPTITGVNAAGQVVGYINGSDGARAVRFTTGVGWEYLHGLENSYALANGINDSGDVVGYRLTSDFALRAYRYSDSTGVQEIAPLPGGTVSAGYAINSAGDIAGFSDTAEGVLRGFVAHVDGSVAALPSLGGVQTLACGINDLGQIAGSSTTPASSSHAIRVDPPSQLIDIPAFNAALNAAACAIDGDGTVGGQADNGKQTHAFRFSNGQMIDLDTFGSGLSNVEGIAKGVTVGWYVVPGSGATHAFVHTDTSGSLDLNSLVDGAGWVLGLAKGVSKKGVIVGEGTFNGTPSVFRLTPIAADTTKPVFTSLSASPATIWPPKGQTVTVTLTAAATDDSGETPACSLASIAGPGAAPVDFNVTGPNTGTVRAVGGRTYTFTEQCADTAGNVATSSVNVTVPADTTGPAISRLDATPSTIWPPNGALVDVRLSVLATDDVDDAPACALTSISSTGTTADDYTITGALTARVRAIGGRTYTLNVRCSDAAGNGSNAATAVVVPPDTTAPVIHWISATPSTIWPPNGKLVPVAVSLAATDNVDAKPTCALASIAGAPAGDSMITGALTASVRADKNSDGSTRTYWLNVSCSDGAGNTSTSAVRVAVTKDGSEDYYQAVPARGKK